MTTITLEAGQVFRRVGEFWVVAFDDEEAVVRDSKGMQYLARLLQHPGRELLALDLAGASARGGECGARLDAEAKHAYRCRYEALVEEREEAARDGDALRAERAELEMEWLRRELAAAVGLAGRDRAQVSAAERARQAVTKSLKAAVARVGAHCPRLGDHLAATLRTGTYCIYAPDPRVPVSWSL